MKKAKQASKAAMTAREKAERNESFWHQLEIIDQQDKDEYKQEKKQRKNIYDSSKLSSLAAPPQW